MTTLHPLVTLFDGRPGLRTTLQVHTCEAPQSTQPQDTAGPAQTSELLPREVAQPTSLGAQPVLDFTSSNDTLDRYHEIIDPAGWHLDTYRRNPVFQNAHNYGDIIFTLGKALHTEVRAGASGSAGPHLFQRIQFATEANPVARIAYALYRGGFLNAVSVGFIPIRWENGTPDTPHRRKFLEQELLEVSAVAIPANPDALALGLKAGAIEKADLADTIDLLRTLAAAPSRAQRLGMASPARTSQLLDFARTLRQILRHT